MGPQTVKYAPTPGLNPLEARHPPLFTTATITFRRREGDRHLFSNNTLLFSIYLTKDAQRDDLKYSKNLQLKALFTKLIYFQTILIYFEQIYYSYFDK